MEETRRDEDNKTRDNGPNAGREEWRTLLAIAFLAGLSVALMAVNPPLTEAAKAY